MLKRRLLLLVAISLVGCAPESRIEVVLDKSDPERLLQFYFGSYVQGGGDPFESRILTRQGRRFYADPAVLDAHHPGLGALLRQRALKNVLSWDSLGSFLAETYYEARGLPPTLQAFKERWSYTEWLAVEVDGPMTKARRRIYVAEQSLREALQSYRQAGNRVRYATGTAIVADHYQDSMLIEHTAMVRRRDGFWDFVTYAADGKLAPATAALPRALATPLQCVGCHFGSKQFEPERSFPDAAPRAPEGLRAYYVDSTARDAEVTRYLEEHARRSDTVLGLYATLYLSRLRAGRDTLSASNLALLNELGL